MVLGLGNPGPRFEGTRHNVGKATVSRLAEHLGVRLRRPWFAPFRLARGRIDGEELYLAIPETYMNLSGNTLPRLLKRTRARPQELLVVCDTLDLPPGRCRMRLSGSSGGQRGLSSVLAAAGTSNVPRMLIGIGRPSRKDQVVDYVLGAPPAAEREALEQAVSRCVEEICRLPVEGPETVMGRLNATPS